MRARRLVVSADLRALRQRLRSDDHAVRAADLHGLLEHADRRRAGTLSPTQGWVLRGRRGVGALLARPDGTLLQAAAGWLEEVGSASEESARVHRGGARLLQLRAG